MFPLEGVFHDTTLWVRRLVEPSTQTMPENIQCTNCGARVLGFSTGDPKPLAGDDCHECGGTEFSRIDGKDGDGDTTGG